MLEAAHVSRARLVLVTVPIISVTEAIIEQVRKINPQMRIVARAEGAEQLRHLQARGLAEVVQPELEAGLEMVRQSLLHMDYGVTEVHRVSTQLRQEMYAPLFGDDSDYQKLVQLGAAAPAVRFRLGRGGARQRDGWPVHRRPGVADTYRRDGRRHHADGQMIANPEPTEADRGVRPAGDCRHRRTASRARSPRRSPRKCLATAGSSEMIVR